MPTTKAQQRASAKYKRENYERIEAFVPIGEKEKIKAHAIEQGESLNAFVNRAIKEAIQNDFKRT